MLQQISTIIICQVEKDNACDAGDAAEEASKQAKLRAEKAEEEVLELVNKARQLETELDQTNERWANCGIHS